MTNKERLLSQNYTATTSANSTVFSRFAITKLTMATDGEDAWREGGLVQRHRHLLHTGFMADCAFVVGVEGGEKKRFKCHKLILGHSSAVFYAMFNGGFNPKEEEEIKDIEPEHFQKFLEYMYLDTVELNDVETAMAVACTANKYLVKTLLNKCLQFINKNCEDPKTVCKVLEFSRLFGAEELQQKCIDFMKAITNEILADENFEHAERATLLTILEQEALFITEVDVFSACLRWARSNSKDETEDDNGLAKTLGPEAVKLIRFLTFTADEFANLVVPTKILSEKTCLAVLCRIVTGTGDIPDEVSDCCDSRSINLELLGIPIACYDDDDVYCTAELGHGGWALNISSTVAAYLHGVRVLASRYPLSIGEEYQEIVKVVIWANNSEQTSESFVGSVKRKESFDIKFKKPFYMMPDIQYVLQLVYHDPNVPYFCYELTESQIKGYIPFTISGDYNHINGIAISIM